MMIGILQAGYIVVFLRINIGYARVSSYDQKKDLQTQIKVLNQFAERQQVLMFSVMSDLGSGLNFKKKGLKQLISIIVVG
jgi:putative resolvase